MVSIYICDDDKIFRQKLYDNLKAKCEKIGIDYTLSLISTFEELKENSSKIDILFLDVLLGDINTINQIIKDDVSVTFELVILTSFPGEIYNISKISPTYYLDKLRSDEKNLSNALNKCIQNLENRRKQKIIIEHEKISETIDLNDVTYIEAQNKASVLYFNDGKSITADLLSKCSINFQQCSRSFAVNFDYVLGFKWHKYILLNGEQITILRSNYKTLTENYKKYLEDQLQTSIEAADHKSVYYGTDNRFKSLFNLAFNSFNLQRLCSFHDYSHTL